MIEKRDCRTKFFTIMHNPFFMSFVVGRGSFGENANKYKISLFTEFARAPHVGAPTGQTGHPLRRPLQAVNGWHMSSGGAPFGTAPTSC